jgi:hypothetical protein
MNFRNILSTVCSALLLSNAANAEATPGTLRFTSAPDIFNWNIGNPQPGWEETINWFFDRLHAEGPDFHLNAGDIMDARWWDSPEQVKAKTGDYSSSSTSPVPAVSSATILIVPKRTGPGKTSI